VTSIVLIWDRFTGYLTFLSADLRERKSVDLKNRLIIPSHQDEKILVDEI